MVAIKRRSLVCPIGVTVDLADADDDDGTDQAYSYDITGALRCLVMQVADGTAGTLGIDVIEISKDGGSTWVVESSAGQGATAMLCSQNDVTGTVLTGGVLNAAGIEPATPRAGWFKVGPYEGPTLIRIGRDTSANNGTDWSAGQAPSVSLIPIGLTAGTLTNESA
jgi:hypothetical protein